MPDFRMQPTFPIASVVEAAQRKGQLDNQTTMQQSELFNSAVEKIGEIGASLHAQRERIAQSLALGKQFDIPDAVAKTMTPDQILKLGEVKRQIQFPIVSPTGQVISTISLPKGSKPTVLPQPKAPGAGDTPKQSQYVDTDGTPLLFNPTTGSYTRATVQDGATAVTRKGDVGSITDATLLANQIPNIKPMFDAYRNSKSPRLQATPAGRLMDPTGKQAENSLKLAAFTFGGKNLTGQEKDVVFGALFPSWSDDEQSRSAKEQLLTNYMTGKIDLMQAANLLGPAGSKMRQVLSKYQGQSPAGQVSQAAPVQAPSPNSDLAHLSTKELMDLRAKMTAHKEKKETK